MGLFVSVVLQLYSVAVVSGFALATLSGTQFLWKVLQKLLCFTKSTGWYYISKSTGKSGRKYPAVLFVKQTIILVDLISRKNHVTLYKPPLLLYRTRT
jgi:hypothetical protein